MTVTDAILYANIVVWLGVAGYAAFLGARQASLARRLKQLEALDNGK